MLNENSHKFFVMFHCWITADGFGFTNHQGVETPDPSTLRVWGRLPSDYTGHSYGGIHIGDEDSAHMFLQMKWHNGGEAYLEMDVRDVSALNYNILDYTDSPIIAGISTYKDWCRIMQVDSIKEHEPITSSVSVWRCQSTWGDIEYSENLHEDGDSVCDLFIDGLDGFEYFFHIAVMPDGLINHFSITRDLPEDKEAYD